MSRTGSRRSSSAEPDDATLIEHLRAGEEGCFEAIFRRHHSPLLSYCRHMLGNRDEAEDALQQAFIRAHRALLGDAPPRELRPWLYAIARNCCLSAIAARRRTDPLEDALPTAVSLAGLSEQVHEREDLRELLADIGRLPEDQRSALLLAELEDLSHQSIATILGCPVNKVKALVHQARSTLIAERDARNASCQDIREQLSVARGGTLRRGPLRRHLNWCVGCRDFQQAVGAQRRSLAAVLPVLPSAGLTARILGHGAAHAAGMAGVGQTSAALAPAGASAGGASAVANSGAGITATGGAGAAGGTGAAGGAGAAAVAGTAGSTSTGAMVGGGLLAKVAVGGTVAALASAGAVAVHHRMTAPVAHRTAHSRVVFRAANVRSEQTADQATPTAVVGPLGVYSQDGSGLPGVNGHGSSGLPGVNSQGSSGLPAASDSAQINLTRGDSALGKHQPPRAARESRRAAHRHRLSIRRHIQRVRQQRRLRQRRHLRRLRHRLHVRHRHHRKNAVRGHPPLPVPAVPTGSGTTKASKQKTRGPRSTSGAPRTLPVTGSGETKPHTGTGERSGPPPSDTKGKGTSGTKGKGTNGSGSAGTGVANPPTSITHPSKGSGAGSTRSGGESAIATTQPLTRATGHSSRCVRQLSRRNRKCAFVSSHRLW
jgi:RNA polymerase sigma factor (sigma-70 family)